MKNFISILVACSTLILNGAEQNNNKNGIITSIAGCICSASIQATGQCLQFLYRNNPVDNYKRYDIGSMIIHNEEQRIGADIEFCITWSPYIAGALAAVSCCGFMYNAGCCPETADCHNCCYECCIRMLDPTTAATLERTHVRKTD